MNGQYCLVIALSISTNRTNLSAEKTQHTSATTKFSYVFHY